MKKVIFSFVVVLFLFIIASTDRGEFRVSQFPLWY